MQNPSLFPTETMHIESQILLMEKALYHAQKNSLVEALDTLIHDDLLFAGPDGQLHGKAEDLVVHQNGDIAFDILEPQEPAIKVLSPYIAVVSVLVQVGARFKGHYSQGLCRYTRVWQLLDGRWQIVAGQVGILS
jgi:hypothetical protein